MTYRTLPLALACVVAMLLVLPARAVDAPPPPPPKLIRIGIIGCDTSHVPAFAKEFNSPNAAGELAGFKVVVAFPGGSPDIPKYSTDRIPAFVEALRKMDVEIVDSIPKLLEKCDAVLVESNDGRPHLAQARPVIEAKKPLFIDKPLAGSLADAIAIAELAKKHGVPWFSSSSIRFGPKLSALRDDPKVGDVVGASVWAPCSLEEHHPDLFWYGVHGVEALYTLMGPGCETVSRVQVPGEQDGGELVTGVWAGGRIGTFRGLRAGKGDYGAVVFGKTGIVPHQGFEGYKPLVVEIAKFFRTGKPPVANDETIELFAFMEAADESKRQGGRPVKVADVMAKARSGGKE